MCKMAARAWTFHLSPPTATRRPAAAPHSTRAARPNVTQRARSQRRPLPCRTAASSNGAVRSGGGGSPEPAGPLSPEELAEQLVGTG